MPRFSFVGSRDRPRLPLLLLVFVSCLGLSGLIGWAPQVARADTDLALIEVLGERPSAGTVIGVGPGAMEIKAANGGETRRLPLGRIIEVRFPARAQPKTKTAPHRLTLLGGSVLRGRVTGADEDALKFTVAGLAAVRIDFEALRSFETLAKKQTGCGDRGDRFPPVDKGDVVYVRGTRDQYRGTLVDADGTNIVFEDSRGRERKVAWTSVLVMHLENDAPGPIAGIHAEVELIDGTRLAASKPPALVGGALHLTLASAPKAAFKIPMALVKALRYSHGEFVYASDLPFEGHTTLSYGTSESDDAEALTGRDYWEREHGVRADRRGNGCPLRLAGRTYRHGFAVHSKSTVRLKLAGAYKSFQGAVGIDDDIRSEVRAAGDDADADARVLGDGKVLWERKGLNLRAGAQTFGPLDVSGVQVLELVIDFGKHGATGDRVSWVQPILVK